MFPTGFPDFTNETRTDAIGMFTGRLGWASNAWLLYVKGGAAVIHNRYHTFITATSRATRAGAGSQALNRRS